MPILGALGSANPRSSSFFSQPLDPFFNDTTLLIGTTGGNFFNRSNNIANDVFGQTTSDTVVSGAVMSDFSPYGYGWSVQIDGSSTLTPPAGLVTAFAGWGGRRRSWDCWVYRSSTATCVLVKAYQAVVANGRWTILINNSNKLQFGWTLSTGSETSVATTASVPTGWSFLSVAVDSLTSTNTTVYLGINGTVQTFTGNNLSTQTSSYTWDAFFDTSQFLPPRFNGYFTGMRFSDNLRYTANFSVPTAPHVSDANTLFLFGQTKNWREESNNYSVTRNGTPNVQPFSPFAQSGEWAKSKNGSSMYIPSTGGYATTFPSSSSWPGSSLVSNDFTMECWIYRQTAGTLDYLMSFMPDASSTQGWYLRIETSNVIRFQYVAGTGLTGTSNIEINCWNHIAVTRSGSTVRIYVNGNIDATSTTFTNGFTPTSVVSTKFKVGADENNANPFQGWITGVRITDSVLTTGAFNPPTQPVTQSTVGWTGANVAASINSARTGIVTHFDFKAIVDYTGKNTLFASGVIVGLITPATPWGAQQNIEFNPAGEYFNLQGLPAPSFNLGTAPFTIEMWIYVTSLAAIRTVMDTSTAGDSTGTGRLLLRINTNGNIALLTTTGSLITSGGTVVVNTWTHIAVTRDSSSVVRIYQAGNQVNTDTVSTVDFSAKASNRPIFGVNGFDAASDPFIGQMTEIRITNNVARYTTSSFPVPTRPFPRKRF